MSDKNAAVQVQTEKKGFTFGFSKTKPKINLSQTEKAKEFQLETNKPDSNIELIKSIEGKKVNTVNKSADDEKKKPLIIPCAKNNLIFDIKREEIRNNKIKAEQENASSSQTEAVQPPLMPNGKIDDMAAIAALIVDSKKKLEEKTTKNKKSEFKFPWWFKIFAYILSFAFAAVSLFFVIIKGLVFGNDMVTKWITSIVISFFTSVVLTQPIKVNKKPCHITQTRTLRSWTHTAPNQFAETLNNSATTSLRLT